MYQAGCACTRCQAGHGFVINPHILRYLLVTLPASFFFSTILAILIINYNSFITPESVFVKPCYAVLVQTEGGQYCKIYQYFMKFMIFAIFVLF